MARPSLLCAAVMLMVCACAVWEARAAVISIDFGGEWIKAALVKPGVPMEIVLNKASKRKTAAAVSMRREERLFGEAALSTGVKYPKSAYGYLQLLLGQKFDSPLVTKYRQWFPYYDMIKDEERGTVLFRHDSETVFSPEELVAMILNYTRNIAEDYAEQQIKDVVITVPVFFTQAQRRAMIYAAQLAGLNVLQLMTNSAATALNYGLYRQATFNTTAQYYIFYDMGALSTTASVVEYRKVQVKEGSVANTYPQLAVKGVGYDRTLGGLEMDIRMRDHLARTFESLKKTQGSVWESPRAMGKLLKEAKRVKQVLSANTEHFAQVEGLLEDVDFRLKVTRDEFEEMCADLLDRVEEPVKQALHAADMTMIEIESVILMGGGTRVPQVQDRLLIAVNKPDLGKSLNTDEAAALGAVYQGAGLTKLFRVKKFIVKDSNTYPIVVSFKKNIIESHDSEAGDSDSDRDSDSDVYEEKVKIVKKTLFQRSNPYPQKKVLTFNRYSSDFAFSSFYDNLGYLSEEEQSYVGRSNLTEVYLVGVEEALSTHSTAEPKGIKAHFRMDNSGVLLLDYVESLFEYPPEKPEKSTFEKIGSTLSNLFGGGSSPEEEVEEGRSESEINSQQTETEQAPTTGETETEPTEEEATPTKEGEEEGKVEAGEQAEEEEGEEGKVEEGEEEGEATEEGVMEEEEEGVQEEEEEEVGEEGGEEGVPIEEGEEEEVEAEDNVPTDEPTPSDSDSEGGDSSEDEGAEEEGGEERSTEGSKEYEDTTNSGDVPPSDSNTTANTTDSESSSSSSGKKQKKEKKEKVPPSSQVVKVNLTAEVTVLDLLPPSSADTDHSTTKLQLLQDRDDEIAANEKAKNSLESHVFETRDKLETEEVAAVSTEEQREEIRTALQEAYDWLDEDGYIAETKVYREKLRELRRISRSMFKRVEEAAKRPKLINNLLDIINRSYGFMFLMKNMSDEHQIFTDIEFSKLATLTNETMEWLLSANTQLKTAPAHEDPPIMSYQFEEQTKKLEREIAYLFNKLKYHPPPIPKARANATNTTAEKTGKEDGKETGTEESVEKEGGVREEKEGEEGGVREEKEGEEGGVREEEMKEEERLEPLELPPAEDTPTQAEDSLPTSSTPRGEL